MKVRNTTTGEILRLALQPFAKGGEGLLYRVVAPEHYISFVAKIYHLDKRTLQRYHKLRYLMLNPPVFEQEEQASLISWPTALLEKQQRFIGFLMPFAKGELLEILATAQLPKSLPKKWQRFKLGTTGALKLRQKVCFNVAVALYHIHKTGHYVMVDLKPDNILIQENGLISLVDMDSVEIVDGNQVLFPAAMATPEFAPPEFHTLKRTTKGIAISWDRFSMAVIFYKILLGIHPFAATSKGRFDEAVSLGEKLRYGLYVHNPPCQPYLKIIPRLHEAFSKLPIVVQSLFNLCFIEGIEKPSFRPNAEEWCLALDASKKEEETALIYEIKNTYSELTIPPLVFFDNSIFENSFDTIFSKPIKKELPQIIKKISSNNQIWCKKGLQGLSLFSIVIAIGFYYSVWEIALFFGVLSIIFGGINWFRKKEIKKDKNGESRQSFFSNLSIDSKWKLLFNQEIEVLFTVYQEQKKQYQVLVTAYYQEVEQLQKKWEQTYLLARKNCISLNREKREKVNEVIQERNGQLLWKQFTGKTVQQKQNFLKKKYLPNQLQQLIKKKEQQVQKIDNKHQHSWRKLEDAFYQRLEEIDQTIVYQKASMKGKEEEVFIAARQKIINAIQAQKKLAQETYKTGEALLKTSVNNYCEQLEAIESVATNKKMLLDQTFERKFQRLINQIEMDQKKAHKMLKNIQNKFLEDYKLLLQPIWSKLKGLGMSNLEFLN